MLVTARRARLETNVEIVKKFHKFLALTKFHETTENLRRTMDVDPIGVNGFGLRTNVPRICKN